jgi:hypothetical protein
MLLSNESTFLGLLNAMQLAFIECNNISVNLSLRIKNKETLVILPTYAATGRWVINYWLSGNKVGRHGFKKYYESLRKIKKFSSSLDYLVYSSQKEEGTSKYKFFTNICEFLINDLPTIAELQCNNTETIKSIKNMSKRLSSEYNNFLSSVDMTLKIMRGSYDYNCKPINKDKPKKQESSLGEQYQIVEQIVNTQLEQLKPYLTKDQLAQFRTKLSKSDNKLSLLTEFMNSIELPF